MSIVRGLSGRPGWPSCIGRRWSYRREGVTVLEILGSLLETHRILVPIRGGGRMQQEIDAKRILDYALRMEETGRDFFLQNSKRFSHGAVVETFEQLASEEEKHIRFIKGLIASLEKGKDGGTTEDLSLESESFFSQRADSEKLDQTVLESMIPACTVLRMAYLIEKDFVEFYQRFAQRTAGKLREALLMLARWEREHEVFIKGYYDRLFDQYIHMPWGG